VEVCLPSDYVAQAITNERKQVVFDQQQGIPEGYVAMDIGPETVNQYRLLVRNARTVLWNGPMGAIDTPVVELDGQRTMPFEAGTAALLDELVALTTAHAAEGALTLVLGGELGSYVHHKGLARYVSHVSLDSRSWLQYLSGKQLHSYHTWLQDEEQARVVVKVLREKDYYQSDGEAYVVERPVYTPVYRRVDEQGNIIDESAPVAVAPQQPVVYVNAEAAKPQNNVYVNAEVVKPQESVYANLADVQVQHAAGTQSQPSTVGQKSGLGLNVNVTGPGGQQRTVASATVGAKAGGKEEKKGFVGSLFG